MGTPRSDSRASAARSGGSGGRGWQRGLALSDGDGKLLDHLHNGGRVLEPGRVLRRRDEAHADAVGEVLLELVRVLHRENVVRLAPEHECLLRDERDALGPDLRLESAALEERGEGVAPVRHLLVEVWEGWRG